MISLRDWKRSAQDRNARSAPTLADPLPTHAEPEADVDYPLVVDFAALRACRASIGSERALATDTDALVETVAQHAYEAGTLQHWSGATLPMRRRVLGGVRRGLEAAGVIRP